MASQEWKAGLPSRGTGWRNQSAEMSPQNATKLILTLGWAPSCIHTGWASQAGEQLCWEGRAWGCGPAASWAWASSLAWLQGWPAHPRLCEQQSQEITGGHYPPSIGSHWITQKTASTFHMLKKNKQWSGNSLQTFRCGKKFNNCPKSVRKNRHRLLVSRLHRTRRYETKAFFCDAMMPTWTRSKSEI